MQDQTTIIRQAIAVLSQGLPEAGPVQTGLPSGQVVPYQTTTPVVHNSYPPYSAGVSDAFTTTAGGHAYINPVLLSTAEQAYEMAAQFPAGSIVSVKNDPGVVYGASGRMQYIITVPGRKDAVNVGQALNDKYRIGIGAPGSWDLSDGAQHIWKLNDATSSAWDTVGVAIL